MRGQKYSHFCLVQGYPELNTFLLLNAGTFHCITIVLTFSYQTRIDTQSSRSLAQ